jgi:hypothetical protein
LLPASDGVTGLANIFSCFFYGTAKSMEVWILFQLEDQFFEMLLIPNEKGICLFGAAIQPPSVHSNISAQGEHFLLEEISGSGIDSFHLKIEMESLSFHQLNASRIHTHLFHLMNGFVDIRDMEASNQIHLFYGGDMI